MFLLESESESLNGGLKFIEAFDTGKLSLEQRAVRPILNNTDNSFLYNLMSNRNSWKKSQNIHIKENGRKVILDRSVIIENKIIEVNVKKIHWKNKASLTPKFPNKFSERLRVTNWLWGSVRSRWCKHCLRCVREGAARGLTQGVASGRVLTWGLDQGKCDTKAKAPVRRLLRHSQMKMIGKCKYEI